LQYILIDHDHEGLAAAALMMIMHLPVRWRDHVSCMDIRSQRRE
jgi:hypothetical protein